MSGRVRLTAKGSGVVALTLSLWTAARVFQNKPLYLLSYLGVGCLVFAVISCGRKPALVALRDDLPVRLTEGASYGYGFSVTASRRVTAVVVSEHADPTLGVAGSLPVASLSSGQVLSGRVRINAASRGRKLLGPLTAARSDAIGLVCKRWTLAAATEMIVHPRISRVGDRVVARAWEDPPIRPPYSAAWPTGFELYGFRDYVEGDDPRRIDWRASARSTNSEGDQRVLVREAEQGITDRVVVIIDTRGRFDVVEATIRFGASVAARHLFDGSDVSIFGGDGPVITRVRGRQRRMEMLDATADIVSSDKPLFASAIAKTSATTHHVVVASELTNDDASSLKQLSSSGAHILLVLVVFDDTDPVVFSRATKTGCSLGEVHGDRSADFSSLVSR